MSWGAGRYNAGIVQNISVVLLALVGSIALPGGLRPVAGFLSRITLPP